MSSSVAESEKALRYIHAVDVARCQGQWHEVPELVRKVEKHAPHRKTFILTARCEAEAATTSITDAADVLRPLIAPLVDSITRPNPHVEDTFQANVCLAWLHWILQEPSQALAQLVEDPHEAYTEASGKATQSKDWIQVCAMKYAYIKGFSLEKTGSFDEATEAYTSMIPLLNEISAKFALGSLSREFRLWIERLLSRCIANARKTRQLTEPSHYGKLLLIYHYWASLFNFSPTDVKPGAQTSSSSFDYELGLEVEFTRWDMWMSYYYALSDILRRRFIYSISYSDSNPQIYASPADYTLKEFRDARLKQRKELKNVEMRIERKLLDETSFPKANVRNDRVERWADAVMDNWNIMCGPNWNDEDLGEGGKIAIAKGVLEILYRAAGKTFHSTRIMRHLFTVHAYSADFDIAFRALDTYIDLFSRAKLKQEKSGQPDFNLDAKDKALWVLSQGISILCQYGRREEIERSQKIAVKLLAWVQEWDVEPQIQEVEPEQTEAPVDQLDRPVPPQIIALAYHSLGMSEAYWARYTYEAGKRTEHHNKAHEYYKLSLSRKYRSSKNLDYLYSHAVLLAEMRDIPGATKIIKQGLAETKSNNVEDSYEQERKLIRFWHLLTLLLSARSDLLNAAKASTAAFEQFQDPAVLFGHQEFKSEHLNNSDKIRNITPALIDEMNPFEKVGILQVKITQVSLLESLEGSESAVDATMDLLAIYHRLFGELHQSNVPQTSAASKAPKSRVGSLRASIFKRSKSRKGDNPRMNIGLPSATTPRPFTSATATTTAPTIQVTDTSNGTETRGRTMNGSASRPSTARPPTSIKGSIRSTNGSNVQRSRSRSKLRKRNSVRESLESFRPISPTAQYEKQLESQRLEESTITSEGGDSINLTYRPSTSVSIATTSTIVPGPNQNRNSLSSIQSGYSTIDQTLNRSGNPAPLFTSQMDRKHKLSVLVELWLYVAGMYMRAELFDDSKDAITEAANLISTMEMDASKISSTVRQFTDSGWGGGKSVDQMWADVFSQRGDLARARTEPHEAIDQFEKALNYYPNHPSAMVGLSELLIEIYTENIACDAAAQPTFVPRSQRGKSTSDTPSIFVSESTELPPPSAPTTPALSRMQTSQSLGGLTTPGTNGTKGSPLETSTTSSTSQRADESIPVKDARAVELTPHDLNRLAARDRAYFLLSTLTKLGTGWDYSEAWYALARAHEESGEIEKAKEVLWWVVELEDTRPLRPWSCAGLHGFLL